MARDYVDPERIAPDVPKIYQQTINKITYEWGNRVPRYPVEPGTRSAYTHMTHLLGTRLSRNPDLERITGMDAHAAGLEVIGLFFHVGAAKAAIQAMGLEELGDALYQPASFMALTPFMKEDNMDARDIEASVGLIQHSSADFNQYSLTPKGLTIPLLPIGRYQVLSEKAEREGTNMEGYEAVSTGDILCEAFHKGVYAYAYRSILRICMNDPNLFPATLALSDRLTGQWGV